MHGFVAVVVVETLLGAVAIGGGSAAVADVAAKGLPSAVNFVAVGAAMVVVVVESLLGAVAVVDGSVVLASIVVEGVTSAGAVFAVSVV